VLAENGLDSESPARFEIVLVDALGVRSLEFEIVRIR